MQPNRKDPKDLSCRPCGHLTGPTKEEGLDESSRFHMRTTKRIKDHRSEGEAVKSTEIPIRRNMVIMSTLEAASSRRGLGAQVYLGSWIGEGNIKTVPHA